MANTYDDSEDVDNLITGKSLERYFDLQEALIEFTELFHNENSGRAAAIVGAAFLDTVLEHILVNFLLDDEKEVQRLLKYDMPLGSFGNKITLAYCLGLIGKSIRDDLRLVQKIRNRFAHDLRVTFDDQQIKSWCLSMKWHEFAMMKAPIGATTPDIFKVGVNQLVAHLHGMVSVARGEKRQIQKSGVVE